MDVNEALSLWAKVEVKVKVRDTVRFAIDERSFDFD